VVRSAFTRAILSAALMSAAVPTSAQLIDRVLVVVATEPITLSDVTAALRLGLVTVAAGEDREDAAVNALIDRQLELTEVNRYVPPEPQASDIDQALANIRARFESAAAFERALGETGLTVERLRSIVRDDLRIQSYIRQRFGASYEPPDEEVLRYYRAHEKDFTSNGVLSPYDAVRQEARRRLIAERNETLVRNWVADLRRRADVTLLPK
jgi:hypothetical protein